MYRIDAADGRHIERRRLTPGSRWQHFKLCDTAEMAREVILVMTEELDK